MKKIGLLSDTHGFLHPAVYKHFTGCDEIWHAGDIGSIAVADELGRFKTLRAVYGNIDGWELRTNYPEIQSFECENVRVLMVHIGGYPGRYEPKIRALIREEHPGLFISGHSHILKVMYDQPNKLLHINPGAAGRTGLHQVITMVRFEINGSDIRNLEVIELPRHPQDGRL